MHDSEEIQLEERMDVRLQLAGGPGKEKDNNAKQEHKRRRHR